MGICVIRLHRLARFVVGFCWRGSASGVATNLEGDEPRFQAFSKSAAANPNLGRLTTRDLALDGLVSRAASIDSGHSGCCAGSGVGDATQGPAEIKIKSISELLSCFLRQNVATIINGF